MVKISGISLNKRMPCLGWYDNDSSLNNFQSRNDEMVAKNRCLFAPSADPPGRRSSLSNRGQWKGGEKD